MKIKIKTWDLTELKSFCTAKETKQDKKELSEWKKIISNEASDKGLCLKSSHHLNVDLCLSASFSAIDLFLNPFASPVLMTIALQSVMKSGKVTPPTLFSFYNIALDIPVPLHSISVLESACFKRKKYLAGI